MTKLTLGENVKWQHGDDLHWETGQVVKDSHPACYIVRHWGSTNQPQGGSVLVALTYGGLAFVEYSKLQRIPDRAEWETKGAV